MPPVGDRTRWRGEGMTGSPAAAHTEHPLVATTPQHHHHDPNTAGPRYPTPPYAIKTVAKPDKTYPLTGPTLSGTTC